MAMTHLAPNQPSVCRLTIAVRGIVQGVGFRPFVYRTAQARGLGGWVQNEAGTVRIEVQGELAQLQAFCETLRRDHPPQARIDSMETRQIPGQVDGQPVFEILQSGARGTPRPTIPADLATCGECLKEIRTLGERRYGYPFTNCTNCGPRWSIIERLPYDRPQTSMAGFPLCSACAAEYHDPADRRFHAQPIACPACGPVLELQDCEGRQIALGSEALPKGAAALRAGQIVAVQGLGGFQLAVDATNAEAVNRLRLRKRRPDKPFAVLFGSLEEARRVCEVSDAEAAVLTSPQAPILLVRRRHGERTAGIAEAVAPGNPLLGAMLPYTPLHHLLMAAVGKPIVCTSGNLSEEPMAITREDARQRLGSIADLFLTHNRPIVRPVDDSVARLGPDGLQLLRRARGYAPLPIELAMDAGECREEQAPSLSAPSISEPSPAGSERTILAVGGHLKNTVALNLGSQVVLSPHVGDLDHVLSVAVHRRAIADLVEFFGVTPNLLACDLHPDYASTRHAEQLAAAWDVPLVRVQHHHAHVAACMAEHHLDGPVLGFAWDGTGYGTDGTVWGGEALVVHGAEFQRFAHLRQFALPGGDRAVRQPRRSALGLLFEVFADKAAEQVAHLFSASELTKLVAVLQRAVHCPRTSSMGRLFDAVAALCGLPAEASFEGQAAMALEFTADPAEQAAYDIRLNHDAEMTSAERPIVLDWEPMIRAVLTDRAAGLPVGKISARFHNALAKSAVAIARRWGGNQVVLTGGCFQNGLLAERVRIGLQESGFRVYTHHLVPPGDGGIALGQLTIAARHDEAT